MLAAYHLGAVVNHRAIRQVTRAMGTYTYQSVGPRVDHLYMHTACNHPEKCTHEHTDTLLASTGMTLQLSAAAAIDVREILFIPTRTI